MQENKDPAITLFGKKIHLPSDTDDPPSTLPITPLEREEEETEKGSVEEGPIETLHQDDASPPINEEATNSEHLPENEANTRAQDESSKPSETGKEQNETTASQEKPLKKPDKILPCPRCNSMDTKFCYYNNYNVNQPRHFCKACQRYWTAGGTMRNVPVGAGRRKNKNSVAHYRNITISEALQAAQIDAPNGTIHPGLKTDGRYLNFGLEAPICESMASLLSLGDKKVLNGTLNDGFHKFEVKGVPLSGEGGATVDDGSSGSSVTVSNSTEGEGRNPQQPVMQNVNGFPAQIPCLTGIPWPYQWNPALQPPVLCPSGIPMPFYAAPYWNCSVPTPWNYPWMSPESQFNQKSPTSGPGSPLGKHSRDGAMLKPDGSPEEEQSKQKAPNGCVLVPKTLRIDDPDEAAKSSIWGTLGIKNESIGSGGIFKGFQSKSNEKKHVAEPSPDLRANPAALSRSLNFQESV